MRLGNCWAMKARGLCAHFDYQAIPDPGRQVLMTKEVAQAFEQLEIKIDNLKVLKQTIIDNPPEVDGGEFDSVVFKGTIDHDIQVVVEELSKHAAVSRYHYDQGRGNCVRFHSPLSDNGFGKQQAGQKKDDGESGESYGESTQFQEYGKFQKVEEMTRHVIKDLWSKTRPFIAIEDKSTRAGVTTAIPLECKRRELKGMLVAPTVRIASDTFRKAVMISADEAMKAEDPDAPKDPDKPRIVSIARDLYDLGFSVFSTIGTRNALAEAGIPATLVSKHSDAGGAPFLKDLIDDGTLQLLINTPIHTGPASAEGRWRAAATARRVPLGGER
jgi:hypothetical protein